MHKLISLSFLAFSFNIFSQQISTDNWTTDLNFLKTELPKKHKNLFFKLSKESFEKGIDNIIEKLDDDTDIETSIKLTQLISKIGDSHTGLGISHILRSKKILPIGLFWLKDGLYISVTSKNNYMLLDKKITAINGYKTETIIDSLKTLFVPENIGIINQNSAKLIKNNILLKHFGFSKPNDSIYNLELLNSKGITFTYDLKEVLRPKNGDKNKIFMKINGKRPFYTNGSPKYFKEKYFPEEKIYFIQYNKCISKESVEKYGNKETAHNYPSFKNFEATVLETIANNDIDKLIFDMRFNPGGSSYLAENLIEEISKNEKINKKNKLFVAVGNKTFSSAIFNTMKFKEITNATIIGEKTGGKPNHYGNIKNFKLPYSGIKVTYSSEFYKLNDKDENTVTPDVIIETSYDDYKKGIDPIFEYVKKQ